MSIPEAVLRLVDKVPDEAYPAVGRMFTHLLNGDRDAAARELELAAETISAHKAIDEAFEAGKRNRPNTGE